MGFRRGPSGAVRNCADYVPFPPASGMTPSPALPSSLLHPHRATARIQGKASRRPDPQVRDFDFNRGMMADRVSAGENISLTSYNQVLRTRLPEAGNPMLLRFLLFVVIYFAVTLLVIFFITRGHDDR